jgi:hypothetical protein
MFEPPDEICNHAGKAHASAIAAALSNEICGG